MHVTAIIAAGGSGRRLGASVAEAVAGRRRPDSPRAQYRRLPFASSGRRSDRCCSAGDVGRAAVMSRVARWRARRPLVAGGERRQDSVANAFAAVSETVDIVLVHDAARPFVTSDVISRAIEGAVAHGAAIAALPVSDTVKRVVIDEARAGGSVIVETLPREEIFLAQTPQAFRREVLRSAIAAGRSAEATDEAMLAERAGYRVHVVTAIRRNVQDHHGRRPRRARAPAIEPPRRDAFGVGYDLHRLVEGRPLVLGGVTVPSERGALGHSDADVICHAVTDAILGAARAGDIGQHYPDTDPRWKGASSIAILERGRRAGARPRLCGGERRRGRHSRAAEDWPVPRRDRVAPRRRDRHRRQPREREREDERGRGRCWPRRGDRRPRGGSADQRLTTRRDCDYADFD